MYERKQFVSASCAGSQISCAREASFFFNIKDRGDNGTHVWSSLITNVSRDMATQHPPHNQAVEVEIN